MPLRWLVDALVPASCAGCDGPLASGVFCARCLESIEPAPNDTVSACMFGGAVADAVRAAKFRRDAAVAEALGRFWVERIVSHACPALPDVDGVAFVPAPYRRRLKRGFDLPAVLALAVAQHAGKPVVDALACNRADAPLSFGADKAARAVSVAGRYRVRSPRAIPRVAERSPRLLLVDDVRTTGATLAEAARILAEAGVDVTPAPFSIAP